MSLATLSDLKTAVADWLERGDLESRLGDFVALAEARMNREIRCERMVVRATASIEGEFRAVPSDLLAPRSMRLAGGSRRLLAFLTSEQMAEVKAAERGRQGELSAYALTGTEFEFFPVPTEPYEVTLSYYAKIPALTEPSSSNWLLARHPDAYLHATVLEAAIYLKDGQLAGGAKALFDEAKAQIAQADRMDSLAANLSPQPSTLPI